MCALLHTSHVRSRMGNTWSCIVTVCTSLRGHCCSFSKLTIYRIPIIHDLTINPLDVSHHFRWNVVRRLQGHLVCPDSMLEGMTMRVRPCLRNILSTDAANSTQRTPKPCHRICQLHRTPLKRDVYSARLQDVLFFHFHHCYIMGNPHDLQFDALTELIMLDKLALMCFANHTNWTGRLIYNAKENECI